MQGNRFRSTKRFWLRRLGEIRAIILGAVCTVFVFSLAIFCVARGKFMEVLLLAKLVSIFS